MTQIIGAVCDKGKKALAISDRMITTADLSLSFEHEEPKCDKLTDNCVALTAGSALIHASIFRNVRITFKDKTRPLISEIVDEVVKEYQKLRIKKMNDEIFRELGLNIEQFYENQEK